MESITQLPANRKLTNGISKLPSQNQRELERMTHCQMVLNKLGDDTLSVKN
jgi:hypothetical protein